MWTSGPMQGSRTSALEHGTPSPQSRKLEAMAYVQFSIWPIELLSELPFSVHIDAIDVSPAQFPPPGWLPENIHVIVHDVFQPFPEHMIGQYDLVHVQNFLCIWRSNKSEMLLQNLVSLLSMSSSRLPIASTRGLGIYI